MLSPLLSRVPSRLLRRLSTSASSSGVGILACELYVPSRYVTQTKLETADGVSAGKYTIGA